LNAIQEFLEAMVVGLSRFAAAVERTATRLFSALVRFFEDAAAWLSRVARAIADYLKRLATALAKAAWALGKLSLFYLPTALCITIAIFGGGGGWLVAGIVWMLFVTGIGLAYWRKVQQSA